MQHPSMKSFPEENRPAEKFKRYGASALSDVELYAVILRNGIPGRNVLDTAQSLIEKGGNSILCIRNLTMKEMMKIPGIGEVKAVQLKCIAELAMRISKTGRLKGMRMTDPASVAAYYMEPLRHETQEQVVVSMFNAAGNLIRDVTVARGSVSSAAVMPREIFRRALLADAVYIILLHNHPSGDPEPSKEDIDFTQRIAACGTSIGILLADHIIIGDRSYFSFREENYLS